MTVSAARVTCATSATPLFTATSDDGDGASAVVRNKGTEAIDVGGSTVTSGAGFELGVGESVPVTLAKGESLYGISPTTNNRIDVLKSGVG